MTQNLIQGKNRWQDELTLLLLNSRDGPIGSRSPLL